MASETIQTELGQVIPLLVKAVESFSRLDVKVESMGKDITLLRDENKELIAKTTDTLATLARISANIEANTNDHKAIHKRIDGLAAEVKALEKTDEEIETSVNSIQKTCQAAGHAELLKRISTIEETLDKLCHSLMIVTYNIKGVPVWLIFVGLVLLGFLSDLANHMEWIQKWWPF